MSDLELTPEFENLLQLMEHSQRNLFITGNAGTGKSTLLKYFRQHTQKNVVVLAPTGIAAVNVGGQTIHSFFRLPPRFIRDLDVRRIPRHKKLFQTLDTVIIDEISMVRADLMDAIDMSLRMNRKCYDKPFGGVQVVAFGDLHQLSPVVNRESETLFKEKYAGPYFFDAKIAREGVFETHELSKVFRQSDPRFIELLNKVRTNSCSPTDLDILNDRLLDPYETPEFEGVVLTSTNAGAAAINRQKLASLQRRSHTFDATVEGKFESGAFPNDEKLVLKEGAQVMLLKNDPGKKWVNGDLGVIEAICDESIFVIINGKMREVKPVQWERVVYEYKEETESIEPETVGVFRQYPLKLAWAMTIHKSQGQTFDQVLIHLERGAFAHGQLYVALSRCRSLEGIQLLSPIKPRDIVFDPQIKRFHAEQGCVA